MATIYPDLSDTWETRRTPYVRLTEAEKLERRIQRRLIQALADEVEIERQERIRLRETIKHDNRIRAKQIERGTVGQGVENTFTESWEVEYLPRAIRSLLRFNPDCLV